MTMEEADVLVPKNVDQQVNMLLKFRLAGYSPSGSFCSKKTVVIF